MRTLEPPWPQAGQKAGRCNQTSRVIYRFVPHFNRANQKISTDKMFTSILFVGLEFSFASHQKWIMLAQVEWSQVRGGKSNEILLAVRFWSKPFVMLLWGWCLAACCTLGTIVYQEVMPTPAVMKITIQTGVKWCEDTNNDQHLSCSSCDRGSCQPGLHHFNTHFYKLISNNPLLCTILCTEAFKKSHLLQYIMVHHKCKALIVIELIGLCADKLFW